MTALDSSGAPGPGDEAREAMDSLDRGIRGWREARRRPRRPRWFEVAVPLALLLVGAGLAWLAGGVFGLPGPLFLVLALVTLAAGLLLLLVGLRSLARTVTALLSAGPTECAPPSSPPMDTP